jgi:hypothetical protein
MAGQDRAAEEWAGAAESRRNGVVFLCGSAADASLLQKAGVSTVVSPGLQDCAAHLEDMLGSHIAILPGMTDEQRNPPAQALVSLAGKVRSSQVVTLPGDYDESGGLASWLLAGHTIAELLTMVRATTATVADAAKAVGSVEPALLLDVRQPFPLSLLPTTVSEFIAAGARSIGCAPSMIGLPALSAMGAVIGNTRRAVPKTGWREPPILWTVIVAESGSLKTPGMNYALEPIHQIQREMFKKFEARQKVHETDVLQYEAQLKTWKKNPGGQPPDKPEAPTVEQVLLNDATVEALLAVQADNPRGVLLARDELSGWWHGFDRYKSSSGSDIPQWIEMHTGGAATVNRKTGDKKVIHVPRAFTAICGGIQPGVLRECLPNESYESGLVARFLFSMPPRTPRVLTADSPPSEVRDRMMKLYRKLFELKFATADNGDEYPLSIPFDSQAFKRLQEFVGTNDKEASAIERRLRPAWVKLEGYVVRIALIIHCAKQAEVELTREIEAAKAAANDSVAGVEPDDDDGEVGDVAEIVAEDSDVATEQDEERPEQPEDEAAAGVEGSTEESTCDDTKKPISEIQAALEQSRQTLAGLPPAARDGLSYKDIADVERITLDEVEKAIELVEWFKGETKRVYARMSETAERKELRDLVELAKRSDGKLTLRELKRHRATYANDPDAAHLALNRLVEAGLATWGRESHSKGGRPSPHIVLVPQPSDQS